MTSPLHDAAWLTRLRTSSDTSEQLLGHLLTDAGAKLTMYWLDLLVQWGPRQGMPGLFTYYDINTFSKRHEALVEQRLSEVYGTAWLIQYSVARTFGYDYTGLYLGKPPSKARLRCQRCRQAVWLSVAVMHQRNPLEFIAARIYDNARYRPSTPFLS